MRRVNITNNFSFKGSYSERGGSPQAAAPLVPESINKGVEVSLMAVGVTARGIEAASTTANSV